MTVRTTLSLVRTSGWPTSRTTDGRTRITIVDQPLNADALTRTLGQRYLIDHASTGQAIVIARAKRSAVAVIPARGPLTRDLRLILPELKIVAVARSATHAANARRLGANAIVQNIRHAHANRA